MKTYQVFATFSYQPDKAVPVSHDSFPTRREAEAELVRLASRYPDEEWTPTAHTVVVADEPSSLYTTTAPEAYDGFGTRTVGTTTDEHGLEVRIVDVIDQHAEWQAGRNGSGMYTLQPYTP